jgi:hypothetical protein
METESQAVAKMTCAQRQHEFSVLIKDQMARQRVSVRQLCAEGVIRPYHRNRFFGRIADGSLSQAEFNLVTERLGIDPVRAALTVHCFESGQAYDDPCCETSAAVAKAIAYQLPEELAACDGEFEPIRDALCKGIGKRTSNAIAKYHTAMEARRDDEAMLERAFG